MVKTAQNNIDHSNVDADAGEKTYNFTIPAYRMTQAQTVIDGLNHRASKNSLPPLTIEFGEPYEITYWDQEAGKQRKRLVIDTVVTGTSPVKDGWEFVAVNEHVMDDDGTSRNILSQIDPEVEIPERYRTTPNLCDICTETGAGHRNRLKTFVVRNVDSGEFKQVGSSCVKDLLPSGQTDVVHLFGLLSAIQSFAGWSDEDEEGGFGGGGRMNNFDILSLLSFAACLIRQMGYEKTRMADTNEENPDSTKQTILSLADPDSDRLRQSLSDANVDLTPTAEDHLKAINSLNWIQEMPDEDLDNQYLSNLKAACSQTQVPAKRVGLVISLISAYSRHERQQATLEREEAMDNPFVGVRGEDVTVEVNITSVKGPFRNGTSMLYVGETESGQIVKWWGHPRNNFQNGDRASITGVVKSTAQDKYLGGASVTELDNVITTDQAEQQQEGDTFVGTVGGMENLEGLTVIDQRAFSGNYGGGRTTSTLNTFENAEGKTLKAFINGGKFNFEMGKTYSFRAKIKEHNPNDRYSGGPVTMLSHVKNVTETSTPEGYGARLAERISSEMPNLQNILETVTTALISGFEGLVSGDSIGSPGSISLGNNETMLNTVKDLVNQWIETEGLPEETTNSLNELKSKTDALASVIDLIKTEGSSSMGSINMGRWVGSEAFQPFYREFVSRSVDAIREGNGEAMANLVGGWRQIVGILQLVSVFTTLLVNAESVEKAEEIRGQLSGLRVSFPLGFNLLESTGAYDALFGEVEEFCNRKIRELGGTTEASNNSRLWSSSFNDNIIGPLS